MVNSQSEVLAEQLTELYGEDERALSRQHLPDKQQSIVQAFAESKSVRIEWNLQLTGLVDNLGLNSPMDRMTTSRKTPLTRGLLNALKTSFSRARTPR